MSTRLVRLEGVDNFRDFGDYATAAGARLRPGRLYRSGHHASATDEDLEAIAALNIAVVVDLRRTIERERMPSRHPATFSGRVIHGDPKEVDDDPFWLMVQDSVLTEAAVRDYLRGYYRTAPFDARHLGLFSRYFGALAAAEGPVLIHCAAGKDRTGMLAALTHHLVGVHPNDILADYLLTNEAAGFDQRVSQALRSLVESTGREHPPEALRVALSVDGEYLRGAVTAIEDRCGSIDAYLEQTLGVDAAARARIEEHLLG
jgi:protein tyrosine/serine phosphatase